MSKATDAINNPADATVKMAFKGHFKLRLDDGREIPFSAGEQDVPIEFADHWYVQENLLKPQVEELPQIPLHPPVDDAARAAIEAEALKAIEESKAAADEAQGKAEAAEAERDDAKAQAEAIKGDLVNVQGERDAAKSEADVAKAEAVAAKAAADEALARVADLERQLEKAKAKKE